MHAASTDSEHQSFNIIDHDDYQSIQCVASGSSCVPHPGYFNSNGESDQLNYVLYAPTFKKCVMSHTDVIIHNNASVILLAYMYQQKQQQ